MSTGVLEAAAIPKIARLQSFSCIRADLDQPAGFLVEAGHYQVVAPEMMRHGYFSSFQYRKLSKDILLVSFSGHVTFDELEAALDNEVMRPGEYKELLAVGAEFREEQEKGTILAPGSLAYGPEGRCVPGLGWTKQLGRVLAPYQCEKWDVSCRFVAVRLLPEKK